MNNLKQFIKTLGLTPNIKLFGVRNDGVAGKEFGAVDVKATPTWTSDLEVPTSKAVNTRIASAISTADGNNVTSGTPVNAVKAQGTFTISGATPVLIAGTSLTVGNSVYTIVAALTDPVVEGEVLIGATDTLTLVNLVAAINGTGFGVTNSCTIDAGVIALSSDATTLIVEAIVAGVSGNDLPLDNTVEIDAGWDDSTLGTTQAGVDGTAGSFGDMYISVDKTKLYMAFADNAITDANWVLVKDNS